MKRFFNYKSIWKFVLNLSLSLLVVINICLPAYSTDDIVPVVNPSDSSSNTKVKFNNPVCLLVGLNSSELSYHEVSSLSGFELFSVPYRSDIRALVEEINPSQIIIAHPSGFVGLYTSGGQLVRGVETTTRQHDITLFPNAVPPSIIQPQEANPIFENVYYPGAVTGQVPHGGLGYQAPPKGRSSLKNLLKIAAFGAIVPFQYPGYFTGTKLGVITEPSNVAASLFYQAIPSTISAASAYSDARFEASEYEFARTQPRDYHFQPVIDGY